jgi:hypothetical protein
MPQRTLAIISVFFLGFAASSATRIETPASAGGLTAGTAPGGNAAQNAGDGVRGDDDGGLVGDVDALKKHIRDLTSRVKSLEKRRHWVASWPSDVFYLPGENASVLSRILSIEAEKGQFVIVRASFSGKGAVNHQGFHWAIAPVDPKTAQIKQSTTPVVQGPAVGDPGISGEYAAAVFELTQSGTAAFHVEVQGPPFIPADPVHKRAALNGAGVIDGLILEAVVLDYNPTAKLDAKK